MKKTTNELPEDARMTIAALIVMDGETRESLNNAILGIRYELKKCKCNDSHVKTLKKNRDTLRCMVSLVTIFRQIEHTLEQGGDPFDLFDEKKAEEDKATYEAILSAINGLKRNEEEQDNNEKGTTVTNEIKEDSKMKIAALLVMDGVTYQEAADMSNKMLREIDVNDQPRGLVMLKNSVALSDVAPILLCNEFAMEDLANGHEPVSDEDKKIKDELDAIIRDINDNTTSENEEGTSMDVTKKVYQGILLDEIMKMNDTLVEEFGNRNVTIYETVDPDAFVKCEVSWSSLGSVTPEAAIRFSEQLMSAIRMSQNFAFNGWYVTTNKDEDMGAAFLRGQAIMDEIIDEWNMSDYKLDPYWLLEHVKLTDDERKLIDDYEDLDDASWADYDVYDRIAVMMMNDGEKAYHVRDLADTMQAYSDGLVEASVKMGTVPSRDVLTLMRNCNALRKAATIIDMHAPVVPILPVPDDDEESLPY